MEMKYSDLAYGPQEIIWNTYTAYVPGFYEADTQERETKLEEAAQDLMRLINRMGYEIGDNGSVDITGCNGNEDDYTAGMENLEIAFGRWCR